MGKDVVMINGVAASGPVRIDVRAGDPVKRGAPAAPANSVTEGQPGVGSLASRIAAEGAPVDAAKVAQIKQAIAEGRYPVDPQKIAARMLELDLPVGGR